MLSRPLFRSRCFFRHQLVCHFNHRRIVIGYLIASGEARRLHLPQDTVIDFLLYAIPLGLICAGCITSPFASTITAKTLLSIFNIREGGMAIYGGVIGGLHILRAKAGPSMRPVHLFRRHVMHGDRDAEHTGKGDKVAPPHGRRRSRRGLRPQLAITL